MSVDEKLDLLLNNIEKQSSVLEKQIADVGAQSGKTAEEIKADIDAHKKDVADQIDEMKKSIAEKRLELGMSKKEVQEFKFGRAFAAMVKGGSGSLRNDAWEAYAPYEKEVLEATQKAHDVTGSAGIGFLVPEELSSDFIDKALAATPLLDVSTILRPRGDLTIPVLATRPDAASVAEGGDSTEITYTWQERRFTPKRASGYSRVSNQATIQSIIDMENLIRMQLGNSLNMVVHKALVDGSGAANEPTGIANVSGMTTVTESAAGRFTLYHGGGMQSDLEEADHPMAGPDGNYGFLMRPAVKFGMKSERIAQYSGDTGGGYVIQPLMSDTALTDALGTKIMTTTHLTKNATTGYSTVIYGDWSHFFIALWQGARIRVSNDATDASGNSAFLKDETWLQIDQYYDCNVGDPTRFVKDSQAMADRSNW